jgi:hypothetical protein
MIILSIQPTATREVRIKGNHFTGCGFVLPSFFPSCHLLNSSTFNTISITDADKKTTWKNLIMNSSFIPCEDKVLPSFAERELRKLMTWYGAVSSIHKPAG